MEKKRPNLSLIVTWIASYLFILLVPTLGSLVVYFEYEKTLDNQAAQFNEYVIKNTARHIENTMVDVRKLYRDIAFNPRISEVYTIGNAEEYYYSKEVQLFLQDLRTYNAYKNNVAFFYVHFKNTNHILTETGIFDSGFFPQIYFGQEAGEILVDGEGKKIFYPDGAVSKGREVTSFDMPIVGNPDIVISILVYNDTFFQNIEEIKWHSLCDIFIFDSRGDRILYKLNQNRADIPRSIYEITKEYSKDHVMIKHISFDTVNMTLVTIAPVKAMTEHLVRLRFLSVALLLTCLLVAVIMTWQFAKHHYKQVKDFLNIFGIAATSNEYSAIRQSIEKILSENKTLTNNFEKQNSAIRLSVLNRILKGSYIGSYDYDTFLRHNISFRHGEFAVISFFIEDINKYFKNEPELTAEKRHVEMNLIVTSIFEELFDSEHSLAYVLDIDGMFACIVNFFPKKDDIIDFIREQCDYGIGIIKKHFFVDVTYAVSEIHNSISKLPIAYSEALQTIEYKNMMDVSIPLCYSEIQKEMKSDYFYTLEKEQMLLNFIRSADVSGATQIINDIMSNIHENQNTSLAYAKCLMFDIAISVLKIQGETNRSEDIDNFAPDKIILYYNNINQLKEWLLVTINEICSKTVMRKQKFNLQEKIIEYVKEHYSDQNLNIDLIGGVFGMTSSYVSKIFKDNYGEALGDFINKYRLSKAKDLMKTEKYTITKISEMVGFSHIRTFNRTFKKYEGITPSMYKSQ